MSIDATFFRFDSNRVVAASAGTGKTFRLAGIAVHALMGASEAVGKMGTEVPPARLVATTFSRKAAAEIRERVRRELSVFLGAPEESPYVKSVVALLGGAGLACDAKALRARAEKALARLDEAFLGTLHAWALRLVKDYPNESRLGHEVRMAGESELESISRAAFHEMLQRAHARGEAAELSRAAAALGGVAGLRRVMVRALDALTELGLAPASLALPDELGALHQVEQLIARALSSLDPKSAETLRSAFGEPHGSSGASKTRSPAWPGSKLAAENEYLGLLRRTLGGATLGTSAATVRSARLHASDYGEACVFARRWLSDFSELLSAQMMEAGAASFGDVIAKCRAMLRDYPAIAHDISLRYDVMLLDEAQDMSRAQADVIALVWHARNLQRPAGVVPSFMEVRAKGLFVVGDRKQSIYGFRGADVRVFTEMCVQIAGEPASLAFGSAPSGAVAPSFAASGTFTTIRPNYRSAPAVLDFANAFSTVRFALASGGTEEGVEAGLAVRNSDVHYVPGTDDLLYPEAAPARPAPEPRWLRAEDKSGMAKTTAAAIAVDLQNRGVAPERVAVLAYRRADLVPIARALSDCGIASVQTARDFYRTQIVSDALALLRVSLDAEDRMAALAVLRGPATGLLDATLMTLVALAGRSALLSLEYAGELALAGAPEDECERYARTARAVLEARAVVHSAQPSVLLHALIVAVSLDEVVAELPDGAEQLANLRKLLRAALEDTSVARFVARMQAERDRATPEEEASSGVHVASSVQLMTVHASKGLDFDAVYFVYSTRRSRSDSAGWSVARSNGGGGATLFARWASENGPYAPLSMIDASAASGGRRDDEDARKAYVAVTRARDALTLVGVRPTEKAAKKSVTPCDEAALTALASAGLVRVEDVSSEETSSTRAQATKAAALPKAYHGTPSWKHMQIAPTSLGDFQRCERLFSLRHVLGAEPLRAALRSSAPRVEPAFAQPGAPPLLSVTAFPGGDAAQQGVIMHRVLEHLPALEFGAPQRATVEALLAREGLEPDDPAQPALLGALLAFASGPFAATCLARGAVLHRELSFVLGVQDQGRTLELRGTADLVVEYPDGCIDIVDYKRGAGPHAELHAFQLGVYTHAMRQRFPNASSIRAGVAFLGEGRGEVQFLPPAASDGERADLLVLADRLARARGLSQFAPQAQPQCEQLHCPYLGTCWPAQAPGGG